jgi:hypothetical protein
MPGCDYTYKFSGVKCKEPAERFLIWHTVHDIRWMARCQEHVVIPVTGQYEIIEEGWYLINQVMEE